eukprot:CAMPEP_0183304054 /NCGR_PEP_ID=MMETSP0160_2-20130417/9277_1 /TAXON_ID=2839 ORGANISM="Odontella Sinensis, Strain Grunow 1884" /NCGR_SAMPLE_ID=MMETSP0160_2 /ASSEMBLY_ACC=CAM_ASM_000250 /LENGTH=90 /DNA_ID=CAMNT_0025467041 /DNA_START=111 /DNA_END=383 /DNA_ORIENTATION=-
MKCAAVATLALAASASAFVPASTPFGVSRDLCLNAKHVEKKATKKHADRRPKKSRRSDRIRKPVEYPAVENRPPEYTVSDAPAVLASKPE